jgi:hypothetical protein
MEDSRVDQAEKMSSPRGFAVPNNNPSKVPSVPSHFTRGALVLRGPQQRYPIATNQLNVREPDNGRLEKPLPTRAIRSGDLPLEYHEISQPKAFSPNNVVNFDNMEAMAMMSKNFKSDDTLSLRSGQHDTLFARSVQHDTLPLRSVQHSRLEDQYSRTNNNLHNGANLDTWRGAKSEPSDFIDNGCSPLAQHGVSRAKPSTYNPEELNRKIQAMMAATQALKPDGAASVRPGPYSPPSSSRAKDGNVLSKMKTAMSHPFQTLANKKSPDPADPRNYIRVISQPQLIGRDIIPQSAIMDRRINEG